MKSRREANRIPPSEMITSVVEAIYDDYAKVNFANYQLRREDLDQLAVFARQFKDLHEFLSQLALISNVDAEAAPVQTTSTKRRSICPACTRQKVSNFIRYS